MDIKEISKYQRRTTRCCGVVFPRRCLSLRNSSEQRRRAANTLPRAVGTDGRAALAATVTTSGQNVAAHFTNVPSAAIRQA